MLSGLEIATNTQFFPFCLFQALAIIDTSCWISKLDVHLITCISGPGCSKAVNPRLINQLTKVFISVLPNAVQH